MATKKKVQDANPLAGQLAWVALFAGALLLAWRVLVIHEQINLADWIGVGVAAVIAFAFGSNDKKILLHMAAAKNTAIGLFTLLALIITGIFVQQSLTPSVIKIGVALPLSGDESFDGQPIYNGAQMAVDEANAALRKKDPIPHYTFKIEQRDYVEKAAKRSPQLAATQLEALRNDPAVAGIIGPYNSDVAVQQIRQLQAGGPLALISPSTTHTCLTRNDSDKCQSENDGGSFFRISALNTKQAQVLTNCLFPMQKQGTCNGLTSHYRTVAIFNDNDEYSSGLARNFSSAWKDAGGTVLLDMATTTNPGDSPDYTGQLRALGAGAAHVDMIFFAGNTSHAITLHQSLKSLQASMPNLLSAGFASGSPIMDNKFVRHLQNDSIPHTDKIFAIVPHKNITDTRKGNNFTRDYNRSKHHSGQEDRFTSHAPAGYFATQLLIEATVQAIHSKDAAEDDQQGADAVTSLRQNIIDNLKSMPYGKPLSATKEWWKYSLNDFYGLKPSPKCLAAIAQTCNFFDSNGDITDDAASIYYWNPNSGSETAPWDVQY